MKTNRKITERAIEQEKMNQTYLEKMDQRGVSIKEETEIFEQLLIRAFKESGVTESEAKEQIEISKLRMLRNLVNYVITGTSTRQNVENNNQTKKEVE